jgi:hypothetical protein
MNIDPLQKKRHNNIELNKYMSERFTDSSQHIEEEI